MGKKSKRSRGGPVAGSKKSATSGTGTDTSNGLRLADTDALDADAMAKQAQALLEVPIPERLDGIISSNDADGFPPMTCMVCMVDFPCLTVETLHRNIAAESLYATTAKGSERRSFPTCSESVAAFSARTPNIRPFFQFFKRRPAQENPGPSSCSG